MSIADTVVALVLGVFIYLGGYQVYFYLQDRTLHRSRTLPRWLTALDERIPRRPVWVWVYTALYYPTVVVAAVLASRDLQQFAYTALVFLVLLAALTVSFMAVPVRTADHWREFDTTASIHHRHLAWVQKVDGDNNCFPSGHAAISVFTGYLLGGLVGVGPGAAFAILVCLSCLYCKQHYVVDVVFGALLGGACIRMHAVLVT